MSARYRSLAEMLDSSKSKGQVVRADKESTKESRRESEKKFSVRKLVHRFEARASESFERTISGRFSSKAKKSKPSKEDAEAKGLAFTSTSEEQCSSSTSWYLEGDKITEDNNGSVSNLSITSFDHIPDDFLERVSLPDTGSICDCYNEFIYLQLTRDNANYLNSYDSDFEEDMSESHVEASNTAISLNFPGDYLHYILFGYYQSPQLGQQTDELHSEADDGFSESEDWVFFGSEEIPADRVYIVKDAICEEANDDRTLKPDKIDGKIAKLSYLIEELLHTERNYVNTLEKGITTYIKKVFNSSPIPPELVNMKYHLFGNVEYIHQFHKSVLLPKLTACGKDAGRIAEVFCKYLENDSFYGYVLYSLYHPKSQRLCVQFSRFFENHQNYIGDKLGVKSFILQPIQRLPRYKLILGSIAEALRKIESTTGSVDTNTQLQLVCKAEASMESFINTMNESMAVNDILECENTEDDEVEMGFGVLKPATVLREQNSENQILFLYPKEHENTERSKPINILHQGKFKKVFPVFFNDLQMGRQYQGKLFMFERCVIYTEQIKQKTLTYRGHFDHQEVSYDFSNLQILKIMSEKNKRHIIEVKINIQNPEPTNLAVIVELLRTMITKRQKNEGFVIESTELTIIRNRTHSNRSSISSITSSFSYYNTCGPEIEEEESGVDCYQKIDFNNNVSSIDQMFNFHQYYEKALEDSLKYYIGCLPRDVRQQMAGLNEIILEMLKIQRNLNFRLFEDDQRRSDLNYLCDIFHDSLKQCDFEIFLRYVERSKSAEAVLMSFEQYFTGHPREDDTICLSIDAFLFLPVDYVNRCHDFFEAVWKDVHGYREQVILRNTVLDYKINYVYGQLGLVRQRVNENYYIRQLIMDVEFLNEIELVQYSDIVKLEESYAAYRLFLMKTGLLCMKIKPETSDKPENYSTVTFYCPYTKSTARNSRRSDTRWYVYLDGRKTTLIFDDKQKRYSLNNRYTKFADQMRSKARVKKRSFFRSSD